MTETETETENPPTFDCRNHRHKVITNDGICVLCGARRVVDARQMPEPAAAPPPAPQELTL